MLKLSQKEWNKMATKYGKQIQEVENKLADSERRIKLLENLQIKEKEANILHSLYPNLKKKILEFEKVRRSDDEVWIKLERFMERNTTYSGYIKSIGISRELKRLIKRKLIKTKNTTQSEPKTKGDRE